MRRKRIKFFLLGASAVLAGVLGASPSFAGAYGAPVRGSENSQARVTPSDSDDVQSSATVTTGSEQSAKPEKHADRLPHRASYKHHKTRMARSETREMTPAMEQKASTTTERGTEIAPGATPPAATGGTTPPTGPQ
jgi:hypothetical protein